MDDEYKIIDSPLSRSITRDGVTIQVRNYRGEYDPVWILEIVDETATSTVWQEPFETDADALKELMRTIDVESIRSFMKKPKSFHIEDGVQLRRFKSF